MRAAFLFLLSLGACGVDCPITPSTPRAGAMIQANVAFDIGAMQHESFSCNGQLVPGAPKGTPGRAQLSCTQSGNGQVGITWSVVELSDIAVGAHASGGISFDHHSAAGTCSGNIDATVTLDVKQRVGGPNPQDSGKTIQSAVTADYVLDGTYHIAVPAQMVQQCSLQAFSFDVPVHLTETAFNPETACE